MARHRRKKRLSIQILLSHFIKKFLRFLMKTDFFESFNAKKTDDYLERVEEVYQWLMNQLK